MTWMILLKKEEVAMLLSLFVNLSLQKRTVLHVEEACGGHELRFSTSDGSDLEVIISDEAIKDLFQALLNYPRISRCFDEAMRRTMKKLQAVEAAKPKAARA